MLTVINTIRTNNSIQPRALNIRNVYVDRKTLNDTFQRNSISFKSKQLSSGRYEDDEIKLIKDTLKSSDDTWKKDLYKNKYKEILANRDVWENVGRHGQGTFDPNNPVERLICGICTLGMTELGVQIDNIGHRKEAKDYVNKMEILRADLQNMKFKEELADITKTEKNSKYKIDYLKEMNDVKENQIKPKLVDLIQNEKEGIPTEIPNCIMFSNKNDKINKELINWTGENINGRFITINKGDDILKHLKEAEENYQDTGDWNLIHVKDMDKLVNHGESEDWVVESMKDIMSAAAEDYHSTLIFSSTNPENLDSIALQPHRVKKIKTENIKTPEDRKIEDAKERLKDKDNVVSTPISTINDLLTVANTGKDIKLGWEHSPEQLNKIEKIIKTTFNSNEANNYCEIFDQAKENLV